MAIRSLRRENKKSVGDSKRKTVLQQHRITGPRLPVVMHQTHSLTLTVALFFCTKGEMSLENAIISTMIPHAG